MEVLTKKALRLKNRDFRKAATVVFIGMILYMILSYLAQNVFGAIYVMSKGAPADPAAGAALIETDTNALGWIASASVAVAGVLTWLYFGAKKRRSLAFPDQTEVQAVFGREKRITVKAMLLSMSAIFVIQLLFVLLMWGVEALLNRAGKTLAGSVAIETDYTVTASMLLYAALFGPFFEELIFRGFVMKGLKQYGKTFAIVTSAFCFALMHGDFQQTLFTFFCGLIFGYVSMEYSILWSFVLHVFNNYILGDLWSGWISTLTESAQNIISFGLLAVLLAVGVAFGLKNRGEIKRYLLENRTQKGTYPRIWCSVWLIAFAIVQILAALGTIHTLTP